jgi:hypothetical protein
MATAQSSAFGPKAAILRGVKVCPTYQPAKAGH